MTSVVFFNLCFEKNSNVVSAASGMVTYDTGPSQLVLRRIKTRLTPFTDDLDLAQGPASPV